MSTAISVIKMMEDNFRIYLEKRGVSEEEYRGSSLEVKEKIIAVYEKTNILLSASAGSSICIEFLCLTSIVM
jgi:hypothetical protein